MSSDRLRLIIPWGAFIAIVLAAASGLVTVGSYQERFKAIESRLQAIEDNQEIRRVEISDIAKRLIVIETDGKWTRKAIERIVTKLDVPVSGGVYRTEKE